MDRAANKSQSKVSTRDDSIVTARVPVEIKRQGNAALKRIGSTPTELINAAYEYVLDHNELPTDRRAVRPGRRELSSDQKSKLMRRGKNMLVKPDGDVLDGCSLKEVLAEMRSADYEALS
ncbi:type II toxin-antitoxin system RelB/DinJ family antitoxin [Raoultibacter massiliensis]|uniref:type II toxin-antitoxin system RelB/DinJ family antitoxin n=1 Tax=Raoultibacter massiliensis TaxID=1852371 RepID=UPI003A90575C